ncbi:MAG TPA: GDSL-type esterase/lipase family protein [Tepidisphaeraceae bacterium]
MAIPFNKDTRFLFIGDAPTEAGRPTDPEEMGWGYVRFVRDFLRARHPAIAPIVVNRGANGLRLVDWLERWPREALAQRSDVVSIHFDVPAPSGPPGAPASKVVEYLTLYRQILEQTSERLPNCKLVLCQPAAVWTASSFEAADALRPYVHGVMELAREFNAASIVPMHEALVYARRSRPDIGWIESDGQFTSSAHMVIAYTWLEEHGMVPRAVS